MGMGTEVTVEDFPDGLRCEDCQRIIHPGENYSERAEGFLDDDLLEVSLICVDCALEGEPPAFNLRRLTDQLIEACMSGDPAAVSSAQSRWDEAYRKIEQALNALAT